MLKHMLAFALLLLLTPAGFTPHANASRADAPHARATAPAVPAPEDVLGFRPGDDRKLASWAQTVEYFRRLAASSPRVRVEELGKTTMGAPFVVATISAPENIERLETYKEIQQHLADPRTILPAREREVKAEGYISNGKTVVLITCGVHSTEVGSYLSGMLIAHRLASSDDVEVREILENTIVLIVPSLNPDGVDIVKNWYDKTLGTPYEGTSPPELYHKYVGHDDNRDWYAFTQIETQLTVDKVHNVWHPQIVHDIHQQGAYGSRLFLPPYMKPVEPNVPKQLVEGYTELGRFMADNMLKAGFKGITWDSTYDAWTPARAYSHYHGGVRILSETASANIATPIKVTSEQLRAGEGYDARKVTPNFPVAWPGGEWHMRDITNYMTTAAFELLKHAARNRDAWLKRFYSIGKDAVRPRRAGEVTGYVISQSRYNGDYAANNLANILRRGGVEVFKLNRAGATYGLPADRYAYIVPMAQPYGAFAKALLERQHYPNLLDEGGLPIPPYDVTAHTLPLLMGVKVTPLTDALPPASMLSRAKIPESVHSITYRPEMLHRESTLRLALYKSHVPSIDEGWTRFVFEGHGLLYTSLEDREVRAGNLRARYNVIVIPDQSPRTILDGYRKGTMPEELTGGLGKEGVKALREFVEQGGTLITLNNASDFAIEQFDLPVSDITDGLKRTEFYCPGSILRIELDTTSPLSQSKVDKDSIAWVEDSPVFEIKSDPAATARVKIIARYPDSGTPLLSGWLLGAEKIRGKAALVEAGLGKGRIYLFGFRPQYRGQSLATYQLLFNAINGAGR
jgi:hypothetical protein